MKFGQVDDMNSVNFDLPVVSNKTKSILSLQNSEVSPSFHFGAPGWSDVKFKGLLYPSKTPQKRFLEAYGKQFNSIEVNATRYGTPKINVLDNWTSQVPESFKFSLKVPQVITHRKDINDPEARVRTEQFLAALFHIKNYSGISFAVMANYFKVDQFSALEKFVDFWPRDQPLAIELRHSSWFEGAVMEEWRELLHSYNIIPVVTDTPGRRDVLHMNLTNDQLFVRYVGDFNHPSDLIRIDAWVDRIRNLCNFGVRDVWFYAHQPGDNRDRILYFFNNMIPKINDALGVDLPLLINYQED